MHVADAHKQKPKIDPATWKSVRTVLTYAGIYLLGVLTMPIWVLIALWVEVSVMGERTQCEGISRTGYWEEVMRSYRDRSKTDTQTNWYGINPLNPETYTVIRDPHATEYSFLLRNHKGDQVTAMVYDDCVVTWGTMSAAERAQFAK